VAGVEKALNQIKDKIKTENLPASFLDPVKKGNIKTTAKQAATNLCDFMDTLIASYKKEEISDEYFKEKALSVLGNVNEFHLFKEKYSRQDTREILSQRANVAILKKHRGYKELLQNLLFAVLTLPLLCIPYLIASVVSKKNTGRWSVFQPATDTGEKIDEVLKEITGITPKK